MYVCMLWLMLTFDVYGSVYHTVLFSTQKDIRLLNPSKPKKVHTIVKDLNEAVAIDYLYNGSLICWTDHGLELIQCAPFNGTHAGSKMTMAKTGISFPDGLACDWLTRKLYWTDGETNRIEVVSLDSRYRKVLFWQEIDQPRGIAVDPTEGVMFWTDWGETPKLEKASMNGDASSRKVIISEQIFWPNSISLDVVSKQLYWIDGKLHFIEVTDYDGRNRRTIAEKGVSYPYSLSLFADKLYWSDWETCSIHAVDRKSGQNAKELLHGSEYIPMDIEVWDELRQPYKHTPCEANNGGCSHLCLLSPFAPGYSCACPTGIKLISNTSCAGEVEEFLLVVERTEITKVSLDTSDHTNVLLPLKGIKHAVGIDYDPIDRYFYWTDQETRSIRKAKLDGSGQEDVIVTDILNPDGIAIDWAGRTFYWCDTAAHRIEVARLDGKYRKVLIFEDLGDPRAIVVSPEYGLLFWSDWNDKKPKIERSYLDGANRAVLVKDDIGWPNGIAFDVNDDGGGGGKLYWGDAKVNKIERVNLDGTDRKEILGENLAHVFGLSLLGDYIYWTDWQRRTVEKINKHSGRERETIFDSLPNIMGLKAVGLKQSYSSNPCSRNNGGCEQLCFSRPNSSFVCACEINYELALDNKRCLVPEAYLIFYSDNHVHRISMQNSYSNDVIPLTGVKSITAIDVDVKNKKLYWADNKLKSISRAYLNGSQIEKVIEFGLYSTESIAIDWLSENIYWIDTGNGRIEVSKVNGSFRKVLYWKNLKTPRNLALDPREGYMYWSEWWQTAGSIIKAAMDGSSSLKQPLIANIGRVNGLTIDYAQRRMYWSQDDNDYATIEISDFDGKNRHQILSDAGYKPFSLSQYEDLIFAVNWNDGLVVQMNKLTGRNNKLIYSQRSRISDLKIVHSSRQTGWNSCVAAVDNDNKGTCSSNSALCLVKPGLSLHTTVANCTCPTHYTLEKDTGSNKDVVCREPENFVLVAQRNVFSRLIMDTDDCPDYPLAITGFKNIRAVEYDPLTKFVYWTDSKVQAIRRSYENNGSYYSNSIFIDGAAVTGRSNHFYDIALDPFLRLLFWICSITDSINVTGLNNNSTVGAVYKAGDGEKLRNIALHPLKGLLFWTDVGNKIRIVRSKVDGQKRMVVVTESSNIESLTIDKVDNSVFYSVSGRIQYCDLDGKNARVLLASSAGVMNNGIFSLTIMNDYIYWPDKESQNLQRMNKYKEGKKEIVMEQVSVTDLITVVAISSAMSVHPCVDSNNNKYKCSHLCVISSENTSLAECSCPIGLILNEDRRTCSSLPVCGKDHFTCSISGGDCISNEWRCDGHVDCPDNSDEMNCTKCRSNQYRCPSGHCIDNSRLCDGIDHCGDGSDEARCCSSDNRANGAMSSSLSSSSSSAYFHCVTSDDCIEMTAVCDGLKQCSDGSDETSEACESKNRVKIDGYTDDTSVGVVTTIALTAVVLCLMVSLAVALKFRLHAKPKRYEDATVLNPLTRSNYADCNSTRIVLNNGGNNKNVASSRTYGIVMIGASSSGIGTAAGNNELSRLNSVVNSSNSIDYPLNPPPSPATTTEIGDEYCCPYIAPPPTPCNTDICDSDFYYKSDN